MGILSYGDGVPIGPSEGSSVFWLIDLSKANAGTERGVLERWHERYGETVSALECLALPTQEADIADTLSTFAVSHTLTVLPLVDPSADADAEVAAAVMERLTGLVSDHDQISVSSFRTSVNTVASAMKQMGHDVATVQFVPVTHGATEVEGWPPGFMSPQEAFPLMARAVSASKTQLRFTTLRPALVEQDERFAKVPDTITARPRFISQLVAQAVQNNVLRVEDHATDPSNPYIHTTAHGQSLAASQVAIPAAAEAETRSSLFITQLRNSRMGPFQEVRTLVYDQMANLLAAGGSTTTNDLVRDAVRAVRTSDDAARFDREKKPFPWSNVRLFILRLMSRRPVLTNDGELVNASWSNTATPINGAVQDWDLALDGELILTLLEQGAVIDMNDLVELSGALFNSRLEEPVDRVIRIVTHLVSTGRVTESDHQDGSLALPIPTD